MWRFQESKTVIKDASFILGGVTMITETKKQRKISDIERLKNQIELVFSINREEYPAKFKIEAMQLVEYLYLYVLEKYKYNRILLPKGNYEEHGLEIFELGLRCIKNYDSKNEKGASFLTYFTKAWELECARIRGREAGNVGATIPERDKRLLGRLKKYLQSKNIVFSPTLHRELVAEVLGVSDERALDIIYLYFLKIESTVLNEEGEEISLLDTIRDVKPTPEEIEEKKERWDEVMKRIEKGFEDLQRTPKLYVNDVITCDVAGVLSYYNEDYSYDYSFINTQLMKEMLYNGIILRGKDISEKYNISPQTLSRAYSTAIKKIWDNMNKRKDFVREHQEQR